MWTLSLIYTDSIEKTELFNSQINCSIQYLSSFIEHTGNPLEGEFLTMEGMRFWEGPGDSMKSHICVIRLPTILDLMIIRLCEDQGIDHLSDTFSGS